MYQTKRFGLVASKQEYMMLCRAERHRKQKEKLTGQRLSAFKVRKINSKFQQKGGVVICHEINSKATIICR